MKPKAHKDSAFHRLTFFVLLIIGWGLLGICLTESNRPPGEATSSSPPPDSASVRWLEEQAAVAQARWLEEKQRNVLCQWDPEIGRSVFDVE